MQVTKAIIPVAGWGTRRLPITKSVEKCMLPLLNRPIVDYTVQECIQAGVTDIYFVVSGPATQLRSYYERNVHLESYLESSGKNALVTEIMPPEHVTFHYIEQDLADSRYGTTVPFWLCRSYISSDELVIVSNGDQYLYRQDGGSETADLLALVSRNRSDGGVIGIPVPESADQYYGLLELDEHGEFRGINEFPKPGDTVSDLKNPGFYVVKGDLLGYADKQMQQPPNEKGEYFFTDILTEYAQSHRIATLRSRAQYFDCGSLESWVKANAALYELTR